MRFPAIEFPAIKFPAMWVRRSSRIPAKVGRALESQFRLTPKAVARLRYAERSGEYAGRRVRLIRVYEPSLVPTASNRAEGGPGYRGLDKQPQAVMFQGHIDADGIVYLTDNRPKLAAP